MKCGKPPEKIKRIDIMEFKSIAEVDKKLKEADRDFNIQ